MKPFTLRDEWYYNMRWIDDMKGVTPILQAVPPDDTRGTEHTKSRKGEIETMAWAFERKDGGRSFGFTGGHFHRNWADENFRRVVVNAILWSAKEEVPERRGEGRVRPGRPEQEPRQKGKGEFKPILPPMAKK